MRKILFFKKFLEVLFQGKELETKMRDKKPGDLSDELRIALGMPVGPVKKIDNLKC